MKSEFIEVHEQYRTYTFPGGEKVMIGNVVSVNVSKSNHHRLNTSNGAKHIVPPGWIHIEFHAEDWTF